MTHRPLVWTFIVLDGLVALFFVRCAFAGIPFMSTLVVEQGGGAALPLTIAFLQIGFSLFAAIPAS